MARERWGSSVKTLVNHWEVPSYLVNWQREDMLYGGAEFQTLIFEGLYPQMLAFANSLRVGSGNNDDTAFTDLLDNSKESLTKLDVIPAALYGVRVYREGAVLAPRKC